MRRWALRIEYDGAGLVGWQRQASGLSVQAALESAASRLAAGVSPASTVAGRTDAGVHAEGQVALITLPDRYTEAQVRDALNFHLRPNPIAVVDAAPAPTDWNPRFSAISRRYRYVILNRPARPALDRRVWHVHRPLSTERMQQAAMLLLGRHDFSSFRASACQAKSPWRTLDRLDVVRDGSRVLIEAEARSFLHHQVRNMVGSLKLVGEGTWAAAQLGAALAARDRRAAGPTAPPDGLTFVSVQYDPDPFSRSVPAR